MQRKKRILIVDDDDHVVQLLALRCQAIGLEVHVAHNALTAINLLDRHAIDLLCLDVNMPTGNGLRMCETLLAEPTSVTFPIVILTGRKDAETIRRCHDLCVYYVLKCPDLWRRLEPVLYELIDLPRAEETSRAPIPPAPARREF
jgi:DNA-binding response OmpR family regulator